MPAGPSLWIGALLGALATGLGRVIAFLPNLLGAIVILLVGWGIGKLIQALVTRGLRAVHFNDVTERAGINTALQRADVKASPANILGVIAYWFIFLLAVQAAVNVLGITALSNLMSAIVLFLPRVFAALLVLVAGAWAASFLGRITRASASTAGISYSSILGSVVQGAALFFTFAIAFDILGLAFPFLTTAFAIIVGSLGLAAAIAFGLGGREYASDIMAGRELRSVFVPGDHVMSDDMDGTIQDIRPTLTMVRTNKGDVAVQNRDLMNKHATKVPGGNLGMSGGDTMPRAA